MTLIQLANFIRIAELQSLSKAAAVIRIAQPALSRQLKDMEAEFGTALVVRHPWGVSLTPAGEVLLERARRIISETEGARDAVQALSDEPAGPVSLGVPTSLAAVLLPELAVILQSKYPKVRPRLVEGFSAVLHAQMIAGDLDLAVLYEDRALRPLSTVPLLRERIVTVVPASWAGTEMSTPPTLIVPARPNRLRLIVDAVMAERGQSPHILEVDSLSAIIAMVKRGAGCTFLPYSSVVEEVVRGAVAVKEITRSQVTRTLHLAHPVGRHPTAALAVVEQELRGLVARLASSLRWDDLTED